MVNVDDIVNTATISSEKCIIETIVIGNMGHAIDQKIQVVEIIVYYPYYLSQREQVLHQVQ